MIRSMTGYGRFEGVINGRMTVFEIKAVNHRYFELQCRVPKSCGFLEEKIRELVSGCINRGKIDVYVSVEADENIAADVRVNHSLAAGYVKALRELCSTYELKEDVSVLALSRYSDIFTVSKAPENEDALTEIVMEAGRKAVADFIAMREREGEKLAADVLGRGKTILSLVSEIEERSPVTVEEYRKKLYDRLKEVLGDTTIDPQRILTEAAIFADKTAVNEETVRLRSHYAQLETMISGNEPTGRKLDFIVQEMNREANTIGSKVCDAELAHKVVDIKAEIEKIREQIQNIE
ncbi:MAG: YicC family protein [Clostridia bacterium]|nr:YicC family protein [Clostridia bacterium]